MWSGNVVMRTGVAEAPEKGDEEDGKDTDDNQSEKATETAHDDAIGKTVVTRLGWQQSSV